MLPRASHIGAALVLWALLPCTIQAQWTRGRITFYDDNKEGSCRYGSNIPTYYGAWPDGQAGAPACGQCFEVACVDMNFRDGYGKTLSRSSACLDESETVVIKIVDSCPCVHENYYSNQRWCCGDMDHLDIGRAAFRKLAPESLGVVGAKWRKVSCPDATATAASTTSASVGASSSATSSAAADSTATGSSSTTTSDSSSTDADDEDTAPRKSRTRSSFFSSWFSDSWFGR